MPEWIEDEIGLFANAGEVGGDIQIGPSYSRRYTFGPVGGRYMIVEEYRYAANDAAYRDSRAHEYYVQTQTMFLICTDLYDPGGSELDAEYVYDDSAFTYPTFGEANDAAYRGVEQSGLWTVRPWDPTEMLRDGRLKVDA